MMNAISSMSSSPAGHQKSSCDTTVSNARGDNQKDDEEDDTFARQSRKEVARALTLHRKLSTVAVCVALSSVCIPVFTKHQRGAPHLNTWLAKVGAIAIALSALSVHSNFISCFNAYITPALQFTGQGNFPADKCSVQAVGAHFYFIKGRRKLFGVRIPSRLASNSHVANGLVILSMATLDQTLSYNNDYMSRVIPDAKVRNALAVVTVGLYYNCSCIAPPLSSHTRKFQWFR